MTKLLAIIKREYLQRVRTKFFVVMTILGPLMLLGFTVVPQLLVGIKTSETRIAVIDQTEETIKKIDEYLTDYEKLFVCGNHNQIDKCSFYFEGLLHECKSNIERMVERVPNADYQKLQHFITNSPWDSFAVMAAVAEKVTKTLTLHPDGTPMLDSIGLILDESGWEKSGNATGACMRACLS